MVAVLRDIFGSFLPGFAVVAVALLALFIAGIVLSRGTPCQVRS